MTVLYSDVIASGMKCSEAILSLTDCFVPRSDVLIYNLQFIINHFFPVFQNAFAG